MSTPNSIIKFYKVPALAPNYRDTYYFSDATAQTNYFDGTSNIKTLDNSQYTRVSNNQVKVPYPHSEMLEYNYMCIQNARWGENGNSNTGKRFYCFIKNVEYVSDFCSLITFEVDVLQTYLIQATLGEAFVERCHVNTDTRYQHREPEPFTVQEYTVDDEIIKEIGCYVVLGIVTGTEYDINGTPHTAQGGAYLANGVFSGSEFLIFDMNDSGEMQLLKDIIDSVASVDSNAITDFYVVPKVSYNGTTGSFLSDSDLPTYKDLNVDILPTVGDTISGYTPVNNKLYNYPFVKIVAYTSEGDSVELLGEEFNVGTGTTIQFRERGSWYGKGEASLMPKNYSIAGSGFIDNFSYMLRLNEFPICSWNGDTYKEWQNQKLAGGSLKAIMDGLGSTLVGTAVGTVINPVIGAGIAARGFLSQVKEVSSLVADNIEMSKKANSIHNAGSCSTLSMSYHYFGWVFERVSISKAEAEQIDNYFTMFGYAQNKIMNIRNYLNNTLRPDFCYIKTHGFSVKGNIPSDYKTKINEIFDSGITFWKTTATVGDYGHNTL